MYGTAKQIEWATKIKPSMIAKATTSVWYAKQVASHCSSMDAAAIEKACFRFDNALATLTMIESAKWWIDNRHAQIDDLVENMATAIKVA
jgi:hypothetical protein